VKTWADSQNTQQADKTGRGTRYLPVTQSEVRGDHLGEIEAHALEEVRLQRHCDKREEDHIVTRHRLDWRSSQSRRRSTARIKQGKRKGGWHRGLTEGLALDLLVRDGAREVEVVHLLLGRLLLMGLRRRGGGDLKGGRGRRVCGRRWRRAPGLADVGAHGGGGGGADWFGAAAAARGLAVWVSV